MLSKSSDLQVLEVGYPSHWCPVLRMDTPEFLLRGRSDQHAVSAMGGRMAATHSLLCFEERRAKSGCRPCHRLTLGVKEKCQEDVEIQGKGRWR